MVTGRSVLPQDRFKTAGNVKVAGKQNKGSQRPKMGVNDNE